ncbi:protein-L-isoaspartate(D-aspartate) o-methyltransferase (PCMT) domain-containing protein [Ditylenchus destructor]|nr:protein-L-isoaspartate(D-aspartate) o-methyltransferase (PCMT) domain-containing protein [Ditylenchus destructor]
MYPTFEHQLKTTSTKITTRLIFAVVLNILAAAPAAAQLYSCPRSLSSRSSEMSFYNSFPKAQIQLVENLARCGTFKSENVKKALLSVDRGDFTAGSPYMDSPQSIGYGATISAPHMHAAALEQLESFVMRNNSRVLDVGSGSGYLAACFAKMVGVGGKVIGIDHIDELVQQSEKNIRKHNADLLDSSILKLVIGDGRLGYPSEAPYDAIHVGAAASEMPKELVEQLAVNGRMVIPVGKYGNQKFIQVDKISPTEIRQKTIAAVIYVPLTSREQQLGQPN